MNPLMTVKWPLIIGFAAAVLIAVLVGGVALNALALARWLHIVSGVFWIGLLYYFNVVQIPGLAAAKPMIRGHLTVNRGFIRGISVSAWERPRIGD